MTTIHSHTMKPFVCYFLLVDSKYIMSSSSQSIFVRPPSYFTGVATKTIAGCGLRCM